MRRSEKRVQRERELAEHIGVLVRARRAARELTLEALGRAANVDPSQLSKLERGEGVVGASTYVDLEQALGWKPGELLVAAIRETRPLKAAMI